jgi:tetratricopeptide (TPR) repeat protein
VDRYIRILEEKVRSASKNEHKIDLLFQIADIYENRLWDKGSAANAYQRVLKIDKLHVDAFNHLERLLKDLENWKALTDLYLGRYESLGGQQEVIPEKNKPEIVSLLQRVAVVAEEKLGDRENAFETLAIAFESIPPTIRRRSPGTHRRSRKQLQELIDMYSTQSRRWTTGS